MLFVESMKKWIWKFDLKRKPLKSECKSTNMYENASLAKLLNLFFSLIALSWLLLILMNREVFPYESARGFFLTILICLQTDFFMSSDQKNRLFSPPFLLWYLGLGDPSMGKNSEMDFFISSLGLFREAAARCTPILVVRLIDIVCRCIYQSIGQLVSLSQRAMPVTESG